MKRFLRLVCCMALVVALVLLSPASAEALSDEMTHVVDSGEIYYTDGVPYRYTTDTAACYSSASATLTYGKIVLLSATIEASVTADHFCYNNSSNVARDGYVSTSVGSDCDCYEVLMPGVITSAIATYKIGSKIEFNASVY